MSKIYGEKSQMKIENTVGLVGLVALVALVASTEAKAARITGLPAGYSLGQPSKLLLRDGGGQAMFPNYLPLSEQDKYFLETDANFVVPIGTFSGIANSTLGDTIFQYDPSDPSGNNLRPIGKLGKVLNVLKPYDINNPAVQYVAAYPSEPGLTQVFNWNSDQPEDRIGHSGFQTAQSLNQKWSTQTVFSSPTTITDYNSDSDVFTTVSKFTIEEPFDKNGALVGNGFQLLGIHWKPTGTLTSDGGEALHLTVTRQWIDDLIASNTPPVVNPPGTPVDPTDPIPTVPNESVPEPLTILGSFMALGFGGLFKKRQQRGSNN